MMIKYKPAPVFGILLLTALVSCAPKPIGISVATPSEMKITIEASSAPLVLVHVWATWCDPCRDEFPDLMKAYAQFEKQGMELMLISGDDPTETELVRHFLKEHNCPVGSLISTELTPKFIETLSPNWAGSLPASFFYSNGTLLEEWEGKRSYEQYAEIIEILLNNQEGDSP